MSSELWKILGMWLIYFFLCRIGKVDVQPHLEEMLSNLFHLLKVQGSQENEYVMKGTLFLCRTLVNLPHKLRHSSTINYLWLDFSVLSSNGLWQLWELTALVLFKWILSCEKGDPSLRFLFPELITHKLQLAGRMTAQLAFLHSQWEPHYLWFTPARTYFVKFSFRWKTP